jgi:hypothetical protein
VKDLLREARIAAFLNEQYRVLFIDPQRSLLEPHYI